MIKAYVHDGSIYLNPQYINQFSIERYIREWKEMHLPMAKEADADHYIYLTKTYHDDEFCEIDFYGVPLSDEEFNKRVSNLLSTKDAYIGAWHKGTNY